MEWGLLLAGGGGTRVNLGMCVIITRSERAAISRGYKCLCLLVGFIGASEGVRVW